MSLTTQTHSPTNENSLVSSLIPQETTFGPSSTGNVDMSSPGASEWHANQTPAVPPSFDASITRRDTRQSYELHGAPVGDLSQRRGEQQQIPRPHMANTFEPNGPTTTGSSDTFVSPPFAGSDPHGPLSSYRIHNFQSAATAAPSSNIPWGMGPNHRLTRHSTFPGDRPLSLPSADTEKPTSFNRKGSGDQTLHPSWYNSLPTEPLGRAIESLRTDYYGGNPLSGDPTFGTTMGSPDSTASFGRKDLNLPESTDNTTEVWGISEHSSQIEHMNLDPTFDQPLNAHQFLSAPSEHTGSLSSSPRAPTLVVPTIPSLPASPLTMNGTVSSYSSSRSHSRSDTCTPLLWDASPEYHHLQDPLTRGRALTRDTMRGELSDFSSTISPGSGSGTDSDCGTVMDIRGDGRPAFPGQQVIHVGHFQNPTEPATWQRGIYPPHHWSPYPSDPYGVPFSTHNNYRLPSVQTSPSPNGFNFSHPPHSPIGIPVVPSISQSAVNIDAPTEAEEAAVARSQSNEYRRQSSSSRRPGRRTEDRALTVAADQIHKEFQRRHNARVPWAAMLFQILRMEGRPTTRRGIVNRLLRYAKQPIPPGLDDYLAQRLGHLLSHNKKFFKRGPDRQTWEVLES